jgi:hypothetical protein
MFFKFGNKKPDIKQYAIIGIVLTTIIATLSQCTGISENKIWDLLDEIQRKYFPQTIINDFIIKDPEKLNRRITRDVDAAIESYEDYEKKHQIINMKNKNILEEIDKSKYSNIQRLIVENAVYYEFKDGTMGIRGSWVSPDPREIPLDNPDK